MAPSARGWIAVEVRTKPGLSRFFSFTDGGPPCPDLRMELRRSFTRMTPCFQQGVRSQTLVKLRALWLHDQPARIKSWRTTAAIHLITRHL